MPGSQMTPKGKTNNKTDIRVKNMPMLTQDTLSAASKLHCLHI